MDMTELGNRYALAAIKDKRAIVAGEIEILKRKLDWAEKSLRHIDACIIILDPTTDPQTLRAKRRQLRIKLYRQGELGGQVLRILRAAPRPLTTPEVVTSLLAVSGYTKDAEATIAPRARSNLSYLVKSGRVRKIGRGRGALWMPVKHGTGAICEPQKPALQVVGSGPPEPSPIALRPR